MLYQLSYEATRWERGEFIELIFSRAVKFRLLISNCLNWKIYCDDHPSLNIQPQYKYELFHIYFTFLVNYYSEFSCVFKVGLYIQRQQLEDILLTSNDFSGKMDV